MPDTMNSSIARGMAEISRRWPGATIKEEPIGSFLVTVPGVKLLPGVYRQAETTVSFELPIGFPQACPADFWTDGELRGAAGALPWGIEPEGDGRMWWIHRLAEWNPQLDTVHNYFYSIVHTRLANPYGTLPRAVELYPSSPERPE